MGRHGEATAHEDERLQSSFPAAAAALLAFPSPASITDSLTSPSLHRVLDHGPSYLMQPTYEDVLDASVVSTMPDDVDREPLASPAVESVPSTGCVVGGSLAPLPTALAPRCPPSTKEGPGLRLPSFEELGIAAPHPDRLENGDGSFEHALLPAFEDGRSRPDIDDQFGASLSKTNSRTMQSPIYHYVNIITPPTESGPPSWSSQPAVQTEGMHSPSPDSQHTPSPPQQGNTVREAVMGGGQSTDVDSSSVGGGSSRNVRPWIEEVADVLLENLRDTTRSPDALRILSHALPKTSPTGHMFGSVIHHLHLSNPTTPIRPTNWINVFHAIPSAVGRFNLADLPSSPPVTPGVAPGGDYFSQTFDSAVSISDYQGEVMPTPRSPRPIVPPSSIDVSIVERYIPPSTSREFAEMFDPNGSSILVDRLVELSPNNGSLLFIYPTKRGAQTFMNEYLGPILDPLLRTMVVVNGLSAALCASIGSMRAVAEMLDHDHLHNRMQALCDRLTQQDTTARRFYGAPSTFSLSYSATQSVKLKRGVWAREWWTSQEKARIKQILAGYSREADSRRTSVTDAFSSHHATSSIVLLQNLLDGVSGRLEQAGEIPAGSGIEVGVFVIKRSSSS